MANTRSGLVAAQIYEVDESGNKKGGVCVDCMFNPYEYTVSKSNSYSEKSSNGSDVPQVEFKKAGAQTLKLTLVFDTYDTGEDVSKTTVELWKLMESKTREDSGKNEKIPPPEVAFEWGGFKFRSVITNMTQKFTLFTEEGQPVRANVDVTFAQHKDEKDYAHQNPTSGGGPIERIWRIKAGERLDIIAAEVYGDAGKWRLIAERNGIFHPLRLRPGQTLSIPEA
jgi:nucleoid-associated protein YgaU